MKVISGDEYELSGGRKFYANNLLISINPDLEIAQGYDGGIHTGPSYHFHGGEVTKTPRTAWAPDEKRELADYMIALWTKYREST